MLFPPGEHSLKGCNPFLSNCNVDLAIFVSGGDFPAILKPENNLSVMEHRYQIDHFYPNPGIELGQFTALGYDRI